MWRCLKELAGGFAVAVAAAAERPSGSLIQ
jgi:hypothetical protein